MKISLTRTGGFAGMTLRVEADSESLPPELQRFVTTIADAPPADDRIRDAFTYEIAIDGRTYRVDEANPLVGWLIDHGKR